MTPTELLKEINKIFYIIATAKVSDSELKYYQRKLKYLNDTLNKVVRREKVK